MYRVDSSTFGLGVDVTALQCISVQLQSDAEKCTILGDAMKKWLVLFMSAFVAGFIVLICIHADCAVRDMVVPLDVLGAQK